MWLCESGCFFIVVVSIWLCLICSVNVLVGLCVSIDMVGLKVLV